MYTASTFGGLTKGFLNKHESLPPPESSDGVDSTNVPSYQQTQPKLNPNILNSTQRVQLYSTPEQTQSIQCGQFENYWDNLDEETNEKNLQN